MRADQVETLPHAPCDIPYTVHLDCQGYIIMSLLHCNPSLEHLHFTPDIFCTQFCVSVYPTLLRTYKHMHMHIFITFSFLKTHTLLIFTLVSSCFLILFLFQLLPSLLLSSQLSLPFQACRIQLLLNVSFCPRHIAYILGNITLKE